MSHIHKSGSLRTVLYFACLISVPLMGQVESPALLALEKGNEKVSFRFGDYMVLRGASRKILSRGRLQAFQNGIVTLSGRNGGDLHSRHISRIDGNYPIFTLVARRTFQAVTAYTIGAVVYDEISSIDYDGYWLGFYVVGVMFVLPGGAAYGLLEGIFYPRSHSIGEDQWRLIEGASHTGDD